MGIDIAPVAVLFGNVASLLDSITQPLGRGDGQTLKSKTGVRDFGRDRE
jgi:hypothetical protein